MAGDGTRDRPGRKPFIHQPVDKTLEIAAVEALNRFVDARAEFSKPLEIAAVTFERVIGQAPFDTQMCQICVDKIMRG